MDAKSVIRTAIESSFLTMDGVMDGVTNEQLHWTPPGTVQTIAASYAHILVCTDWQIHSLFQDKKGLWETTWLEQTGIFEPAPFITPAWGKSVRVDFAQAKSYDATVRQITMDFVEDLDDPDRVIDLTSVGFGTQNMTWALTTLVAGHWNTLAGEISAVKGMQGLKGFPF